MFFGTTAFLLLYFGETGIHPILIDIKVKKGKTGLYEGKHIYAEASEFFFIVRFLREKRKVPGDAAFREDWYGKSSYIGCIHLLSERGKSYF